jgi:hypothetical protein
LLLTLDHGPLLADEVLEPLDLVCLILLRRRRRVIVPWLPRLAKGERWRIRRRRRGILVRKPIFRNFNGVLGLDGDGISF